MQQLTRGRDAHTTRGVGRSKRVSFFKTYNVIKKDKNLQNGRAEGHRQTRRGKIISRGNFLGSSTSNCSCRCLAVDLLSAVVMSSMGC